uniref:Peptidase S1 domain-containing protein n=2 Tax=Timema TaxID=61471 RepID=A0A7R9K496_TIMGE|nr:unnamed protein product [Timema genevievae]
MGPQGGKDKNYYKNNLKEDAWKDITTLAGQAEDVCKRKIISLFGPILSKKFSKSVGDIVLALEHNGELFCGSSAIGEYWVLTAGHCIFFSNPENIKVRAGSLQQGKNGTLHEVAEFVSHPKFDLNLDMDNDIGLIKLKDPLSSNPYVRYVGLPDQGEPTPIGSRLVVAGWGCTKPPKLANQYRVLSSFFRHQSHSSPHYYTSYGSSSRPAPEDQQNVKREKHKRALQRFQDEKKLQKMLLCQTKKHTGMSFPDSSTLRKNYVSRCYENTMKKIQEKVAEKKILVSMDETTDSLGRYVANVVVAMKQPQLKLRRNFFLILKLQFMEGGTSPVLKKAYADVLEPAKCEEHPMMAGTHVVSNNMICAMQEGHTAYKGDSGGPLFDQIDGKIKQIGVVSWGDYLGHQSLPTVYAKVSQFRLWIFLKTNI